MTSLGRVSVAALLLLFSIGFATAQTNTTAQTTQTVVVDANATPCVSAQAHYPTIQAAASAVRSGAVILICPGTYPEQVVINTSMTLKGVISGNSGAAVITVPRSGMLLTGALSFVGSAAKAVQVLVEATNVTIIDVAVDGNGAFTGCASPSLYGIGFDQNSSGTLRRVALRNQNIPDGNGRYCGTLGSFFGGTGILSAGNVAVLDSSIRAFDAVGLWAESSPITVKTTVFNPVAGGTWACLVDFGGGMLTGNTISNCAAGLQFDGPATVTWNTIVGGGISCLLACTGVNVSYNTISDATHGFGWGIGGESPGIITGSTIQYNDISGSQIGIAILGGAVQSHNTVSNNVINDATLGIAGASNDTVSNNTYLNVTTLTQ